MISATQVRRGTGETQVGGHVKRDGQPVQRAYITILDSHGDFATEVWCGPDGAFQLDLQPGEWRLVCLAPGIRLERTIQLLEGDHTEVEVQL